MIFRYKNNKNWTEMLEENVEIPSHVIKSNKKITKIEEKKTKLLCGECGKIIKYYFLVFLFSS